MAKMGHGLINVRGLGGSSAMEVELGYESPPEDGGFMDANNSLLNNHTNEITERLPVAIRDKLAVAKTIDGTLENTYLTGSMALYLHQVMHNIDEDERVQPDDLDIIFVTSKINRLPMLRSWRIYNDHFSGDSSNGVTFVSENHNFLLDLIKGPRSKTPEDDVKRKTDTYLGVNIIKLERLRSQYYDIAKTKATPKWRAAEKKLKMIYALLNVDE